MKAYIDSSVVMRMVFGERERLDEWGNIDTYISSILLFIECFRIVDRARFDARASETALDKYRPTLMQIIENVQIVEMDEPVIVRAAQPLPFAIRTLDAIHLATAIEWRNRNDRNLHFATHDRQLGAAAHEVGFEVIGL